MWTGDNLPVLRGLNSESIDLVYLDPPFNSNRQYAAPIGSKAAGAAFKDTWTLSDVDDAWHGEIAEQAPAVYAAINAAGIVHGSSMKSYLIMMAVRLLEMRRLLKRTGSLYLHCDDTADAYLRMLCDAVFGRSALKAVLTWQRIASHNDGAQGRRQYGRVSDRLLFYTRGSKWTWNPQYMPYDQSYVDRFYRHVEPGTGRRYRLGDLTGPGGQAKGNPEYEVMGVTRYWRYSRERMQELIDAGRVVQTAPGRVPAYKRYLDEMPGKPAVDIWTDIPPIGPAARERTGYPTQKPLKLLNRIIQASSNPGHVVLDPFAGCATACVSAESLHREWIGIDLSSLAARLVESRLRDEFGVFAEIRHLTDVPRRTDTGELPNYRTHKHQLFGRQEGHCGGCGVVFPFRNFTIDHIVPRSAGGTDHIDNLQLLCGACNSTKGTRSQAYLLATLRKRGMLRAEPAARRARSAG